MDVDWFLKQRTNFIRRFYENGSSGFTEIIRKIDAEEPPFEPPYSEDGEPAFLEEWIDATTSLEILGATCISMLAESLKLYFLTWEEMLGVKFPDVKKGGWLQKFKMGIGDRLKIDWSDCPVDFAVLDQIELARNDSQHPKELVFMHLSHGVSTIQKHTVPFFLSEDEERLLSQDASNYVLSRPKLVVTVEKLDAAISEVNSLAEWLEEQLQDARYGRR